MRVGKTPISKLSQKPLFKSEAKLEAIDMKTTF